MSSKADKHPITTEVNRLITERVAPLYVRIEELETSLENRRDEIQELEQRLTRHGDRLNDCDREIDSNKGDIRNLESRS